MVYSLLGKDFFSPDVRGKVNGNAKFSENFQVDGMVFCRLLTSPLPHGRVVSIDTSAALAMEGVLGILTADEIPTPSGTVSDALGGYYFNRTPVSCRYDSQCSFWETSITQTIGG